MTLMCISDLVALVMKDVKHYSELRDKFTTLESLSKFWE